jgi:hypothetical protein
LAEDLGQTRCTGAPTAFEPIGLILHEDLEDRGPVTPVGAWPFASTGGDGVHFSFLPREGRVGDDSPIVMTVPTVGENVIVGADLTEFLGLGIRFGYFVLERIVHDGREFFDAYRSKGNSRYRASAGGRYQLDTIASAFGVKPWPGAIENRLALLQAFHGHLVRRPSEAPASSVRARLEQAPRARSKP